MAMALSDQMNGVPSDCKTARLLEAESKIHGIEQLPAKHNDG